MHEAVKELPATNLMSAGESGNTKRLPRLRRLGRVVAASLILSGGALALEGDERLPDQVFLNNHEAAPLPDEVTIMTANVHGWRQPESSNLEWFYSMTAMAAGEFNNFDVFLRAVSEAQPDIICLQEVLADGPELMMLHQQGYNIFFDTTERYPVRGRFGNAIASLTPFIETHTLKLPSPRTSTDRNAVLAYVRTESGAIMRIVNTHLSVNMTESEIQGAYIVDKLEDQASFFCGDSNQPETVLEQGALGLLASYDIAYSEVLTYPASSPNRAIDFIFANCAEPDDSIPVLYVTGSDHLARTERFSVSGC